MLNFSEACAFLGYAKSYVYKLTSGGIIPFSRPNGGKIYFDRDKLEAWLLSNSHQGKHERDITAATHVSTASMRAKKERRLMI